MLVAFTDAFIAFAALAIGVIGVICLASVGLPDDSSGKDSSTKPRAALMDSPSEHSSTESENPTD